MLSPRSPRLRYGAGAAGGLLLLGAVLVAPYGSGPARSAAADTLPATPAAGLTAEPGSGTETEAEALRAKVDALSTEVARLAGDEDEALAGRLGGERGGFTVAYGPPIAYVGPDDVVYEFAVGDEPAITGRVTATFDDGRATRLVVVPDRPLDQPLDEPADADWGADEAPPALTAFLPADVDLAADEIDPLDVDEVTGASDALAAATGGAEVGACPPAGGTGFVAAFTRPTEETISAITLAASSGGGGLAAGELVGADQGRTRDGASAVANSSLGGVVTVNGIRVQAFNARPDAEVEGAAPSEGSLYAVEVEIANDGRRPLPYQPSDFVLVDGDGNELSASCGGVEPGITSGEIAAGEAVSGWVTFVVPDGFAPERFVFLGPDARVGFGL